MAIFGLGSNFGHSEGWAVPTVLVWLIIEPSPYFRPTTKSTHLWMGTKKGVIQLAIVQNDCMRIAWVNGLKNGMFFFFYQVFALSLTPFGYCHQKGRIVLGTPFVLELL